MSYLATPLKMIWRSRAWATLIPPVSHPKWCRSGKSLSSVSSANGRGNHIPAPNKCGVVVSLMLEFGGDVSSLHLFSYPPLVQCHSHLGGLPNAVRSLGLHYSFFLLRKLYFLYSNRFGAFLFTSRCPDLKPGLGILLVPWSADFEVEIQIGKKIKVVCLGVWGGHGESGTPSSCLKGFLTLTAYNWI